MQEHNANKIPLLLNKNKKKERSSPIVKIRNFEY